MTLLALTGRGLLRTHKTFQQLTPAEARQWGMANLRRYADGLAKKRTRRAIVHMHDLTSGRYNTQHISYTPR